MTVTLQSLNRCVRGNIIRESCVDRIKLLQQQ